MKKYRISFKDNGQDFLWWDLDESARVIDCGPKKGDWIGTKVLLIDKLQPGMHPEILQKGVPLRLIQQVMKIELYD